jgi:predicted nucleic acid-binding protein
VARVILADTDVLIDALRGGDSQRERIAEAIAQGTLATSALTVFELCIGARTEIEQAAIDALLAPLPVLPVDDAVARVAAAVGKDLRRKGVSIGFADTVIAGTCLVAGASLFTRNTRHFGRIPGLRIEPPEDGGRP